MWCGVIGFLNTETIYHCYLDFILNKYSTESFIQKCQDEMLVHMSILGLTLELTVKSPPP